VVGSMEGEGARGGRVARAGGGGGGKRGGGSSVGIRLSPC